MIAHYVGLLSSAGTHLNIGDKGSVFILTEEERHRLEEIHKEELASLP
jgi:hypothetical protein